MERNVLGIPRLQNQRLTVKAELSLAYQLKLESFSVTLGILRNRKTFQFARNTAWQTPELVYEKAAR